MMSSSFHGCLVVLSIATVLGCGGEGDGGGKGGGSADGSCSGKSVSLAADVVPITKGNCAGNQLCHDGMDSAKGVYDFAVNKPATECHDGRKLVVPGEPAHSYLIDKLKNHDLCSGGPMPLGRHLPDPDIQTFVDWVCGGAKND